MSAGNLPKIDTSSAVPRYVQAKTILAEAIRRGDFAAGAKLPSTGHIGAQINVSLITAHKAIQSLVQEGWLRRERGRGTFVRTDFQVSVAARPRFRVALILQPGNSPGRCYMGAVMAGVRRAMARSHIPGELGIRARSGPADLGVIDSDAFLCLQPNTEDFVRLAAAGRRKAVVVVGGGGRESSVCSVDCDDAHGTRLAVRHLIEGGHERIAIVNGPLAAASAACCQEAYLAQLKAHALPVRPAQVFNARTSQDGNEMMARLSKTLRRANRPTAIVACRYEWTLDVMAMLRQLKITIPRDVSLVGFDDPPSAKLLSPGLTTVRRPLEEMGFRAYGRIVQRIRGAPPSPRVELLPPELIVRESTGPVRQP